MVRLSLFSVWIMAPWAFGGSSVGHPVPIKAGLTDDLIFTEVLVPVADVVVEDCTGSPKIHALDVTLDVLDATIELPEGEWCSIRIDLDGTVEATGDGPDGATFALALEVASIELDFTGAVDIDEHSSVAVELAFPGWLSAVVQNLQANTLFEVEAGDALHDTLTDYVAGDSTLD